MGRRRLQPQPRATAAVALLSALLLLLVLSTAAALPDGTGSGLSARVQSLLAGMTLEQKTGQMLQLDLVGFLNPGTLEVNRTRLEETLRKYHVGSILNSPFTLGPSGGKDGWTAADWKGVVRSIHQAALAQGEVPVLYGIDRYVHILESMCSFFFVFLRIQVCMYMINPDGLTHHHTRKSHTACTAPITSTARRSSPSRSTRPRPSTARS